MDESDAANQASNTGTTEVPLAMEDGPVAGDAPPAFPLPPPGDRIKTLLGGIVLAGIIALALSCLETIKEMLAASVR
jgi:hypothetical protein